MLNNNKLMQIQFNKIKYSHKINYLLFNKIHLISPFNNDTIKQKFLSNYIKINKI